MELIRGLYNLKEEHRSCVVTIGNFDGLHLGHQKLIMRLIAKSQELKLPSLAIIFEPQPSEYFCKEQNAPRLMRFREKIDGLRDLGIDRILSLCFNEAIALQPAEVFVRETLVEKLAAKYVLVGDDFRFGYKRLGDYALLAELGKRYFFKTEAMDTFIMMEDRVSSTRIRKLLNQGEVEKAGLLLGRCFGMKGKIAHGDKRGRIIGFPTANIHLHRKEVPVKGVFAVEMLGIDPLPIPGVANVGTRPTLSGEKRTLLEVHLFNFNREIYGRYVEIRFLHKFRDEKKFSTVEELKQQIDKDVIQAKKYHQLKMVY